MHTRPLLILVLLALPSGMAIPAATCTPVNNTPVADTVKVNFLNDTPFDVDAFVNGTFIITIPAGQLAPVQTLNCSPGIELDVDGDMVTPNGTFRSVNFVFFNEGVHFSCGGTLGVDYTLDVNRDLSVAGNVQQ